MKVKNIHSWASPLTHCQTLKREILKFRDLLTYVKKVPANADAELVFDIYEDINSGADDLTSQQKRQAAFNGPYMSMIQGLRTNKDFLAIRGSLELDMKESDGEMILRFLFQ
jgi:hypothetical protein